MKNIIILFTLLFSINLSSQSDDVYFFDAASHFITTKDYHKALEFNKCIADPDSTLTYTQRALIYTGMYIEEPSSEIFTKAVNCIEIVNNCLIISPLSSEQRRQVAVQTLRITEVLDHYSDLHLEALKK